MESPTRKFILRLVRTAFIITSVLSFFDCLQNPSFIERCPAYSTYKYLLLTKISLLFILLSSVSGIVHRIGGYTCRFHSFFLSTSMCFETVVFSLFWGILFFDKKLIVDKSAIKSGTESSTMNKLFSHTFPLILAYLNMHDRSFSYSSNHILFFTVFALCYFLAMMYYTTNLGKDFYPFMSKMSVGGKAMLFLGISAILIVIYMINARFFGIRNKKRD